MRILAQCGEAFQKELDSSGGVVTVRAVLWGKQASHGEESRGGLHANPAP